MNLVSTGRLEIQINRILPVVSHMRWSMFSVLEFPRSKFQADTRLEFWGRVKNYILKKTATSLFAGSLTSSLESATVVQYR